MKKTYCALLRGINVGGNNIIPMSELRRLCESLGLENVATYIQSGNVLFTAKESDPRKLELMLEKALSKKFKYTAVVVVKSLKEMTKIAANIPKSWDGNNARRYNVLFLRHAIDSKKILKELQPKDEIEEVSYGPGVLYWSALTSALTRSSLVKFAAHRLYKEVTIRNLNTTKKLCALVKELGAQ